MINDQNNMSGESQPLMCVQKVRRHDTFRSWLSKSTHSQSDRGQGIFNKFVTKYSSQANAFAITVQCADVTISCEVLVDIVRVSVLDQTKLAVVHSITEQM